LELNLQRLAAQSIASKHIAGDSNFMRAFVSILIPAYNAENWIADTLESAIAQTWSHKEIIVVDDGSTDGTLAIARRFEPEGVRVVTQPNQGAAAARNRASSLSRGDYIQWLDADDLLSPGKITLQMQAAEETRDWRTLFSSPWAFFRYRPARARFVPSPLWCDLAPTEWMIRKWEGNLHMQTATWLVSRELTEAAGPWDTRLTLDDDGEYFSRVINASNGIRFVPQSSVYYRITPTSRLSYIGRSNKKMESQFLSMKLQIGYLRARDDSDRVRAACVNYLQTWLPAFYPNRPDLMQETQQLADSLGGQLSLPEASWKYALIEKLFGFAAAKHTQLYYNRVKTCALSAWDKMMYLFERRGRLVS
jgi:glycosyltransferase involved in cell wall biosynthesis